MPLTVLPDAGSHRACCRPLRCKPPNPATSALFALANGNTAASHASATGAAYALKERMFRLAGGSVPATPMQIAEFLAAFAGKLAIATLERRLTISSIETGYVFRAVDRHDRVGDAPLTAQSVTLIVKNAIGKVVRTDTEISGHSMRAGYSTQAAIAGLQPFQIREQTGHTSDATLARYIRPVAERKKPRCYQTNTPVRAPWTCTGVRSLCR